MNQEPPVRGVLQRSSVLGGEGHPVAVAHAEALMASAEKISELQRHIMETGMLPDGGMAALNMFCEEYNIGPMQVCSTCGNTRSLSPEQMLGQVARRVKEELSKLQKEALSRKLTL